MRSGFEGGNERQTIPASCGQPARDNLLYATTDDCVHNDLVTVCLTALYRVIYVNGSLNGNGDLEGIVWYGIVEFNVPLDTV